VRLFEKFAGTGTDALATEKKLIQRVICDSSTAELTFSTLQYTNRILFCMQKIQHGQC
jgi:hypothetical protein